MKFCLTALYSSVFGKFWFEWLNTPLSYGAHWWTHLDDVFVSLCHMQVQAELDVSQLNYVFIVWCKVNTGSENDWLSCNKRQTWCSVLYMLTFFTQFRNGFFIKRPICCSPSSRETYQALLGVVYVTMRQNKYDQVDL